MSKPLKKFTATIKRLCTLAEMDTEDRAYWGEARVIRRTVHAYDANHAADLFHNAFPIDCLDHFEISFKEEK